MKPEIESVEIFADIDEEIGRDRHDDIQQAERLTRKLERVLADWDLNLALGGYINNIILAGLVDSGEISKEQAERISKINLETLRSGFTTEELAEMDQEHEEWKNLPESSRLKYKTHPFLPIRVPRL